MYTIQKGIECINNESDYIIRIRPDRSVSMLPNMDILSKLMKNSTIICSPMKNRPKFCSDQWFGGETACVKQIFSKCYDCLIDEPLISNMYKKSNDFIIEYFVTEIIKKNNTKKENQIKYVAGPAQYNY